MDAVELLFRRAVAICKTLMADEDLDISNETVFKTCLPLVVSKLSADKSPNEGETRGKVATSKQPSDRETD